MSSPVSFEIPSECWAGVVINEGPDFSIEVQKVPVPEPGSYSFWQGRCVRKSAVWA